MLSALTMGAMGTWATSPIAAAAPRPQRVRFGRIERWDPFPSRHIDPRPVEVWLPPTYDGREPHAVLYMHDGQMLFDADTTWNHQAWAVDQVAAPLLARGELRPFIVVAPWNNGPKRFAEYFPQAWLRDLQGAPRQAVLDRFDGGVPRGNDSLRFLADELKPAVDARYTTRTEREHTLLMGSSMGGLISLYGLCERPDLYGGAACISTHWTGYFERNAAVPAAALRYLREKLPPPGTVRVWMDRGTQELDALYDDAQMAVDTLLLQRGYRAPGFRSVVHEGSGHNEADWQRHLPGPLLHLLGA